MKNKAKLLIASLLILGLRTMAGDEREAYRLPAKLPEPAENRRTYR